MRGSDQLAKVDIRKPMRIGVVGAGGAGGYFAGRWSEAGLDVTLMARGDHYDAIAENGLQIISPLGEATVRPEVVNQGEDMSGLDVVIYATKTWQLPEAIEATLPVISPGTLVFGIQNGVESADVLAEHIPHALVLGATCRIISLIEKPGVIRHVGADPTIIFGGWREALPNQLDSLSDLLTVEGKATVIHVSDIRTELWKKFLFFAPLSGIGAMHDLPIGDIRSDPAIRRQLEEAMNEVASVATAHGIRLGANEVAMALDFVGIQPAEGTSSLHRDVVAGRQTEFESLSAHIVKLGREVGVPTPTHATIVDEIKRKTDCL